jgi:hypothetical protein
MNANDAPPKVGISYVADKGSPSTSKTAATDGLPSSAKPTTVFRAYRRASCPRAGLFHQASPYPWQSPQQDLSEARRLIEKHGYWRRKEELEGLEAVILGRS